MSTLRGIAAVGLLWAAAGAAPAAPADPAAVQDRIDWPAFLARHDLRWDRIPRQWHEGAFLGNGLLGTMIWAQDAEALHFDVGRSDVTDRGNRLAIGRFELVTAGAAKGGDLRLDLWNAEATGNVRTDRGAIRWRAFTHAERLVNVVELDGTGGEASATLEFRQEPALDARKAYKKEPIPESERNPEPSTGETDGIHWCAQPFKAGGGYVVAWARSGAIFAWTVDFAPAGAPDPARAAAAVRAALKDGIKDLVATHRAWWNAYWPQGFLSIPDTRMESFYFIQMYKLASATRADRPAIDLMGPWFRATPWPKIWWNLNLQLTYWPVYAANRLELGESLTRMLDAGASNLVANVPAEMRADSAGIGRTSSYDCLGGAGSEIGNLTWAMHNYWLQYRCSGDEAMLRGRLHPLLKRAATYMIRRLEPGADGRLHFPADTSPEYPERAPDTNYNLGLLRWALQTLIAADARLGLKDPEAARWRETLEKLAPFPVDARTGLEIGRGVPLAVSHRHFSHLLLFYPLHVADPDDPAMRPLLERSLDHWISFEGALQGYSFTGASAMSSWLRRRGPNADLLNQFLDRYVKANTMYLEAGPVIETPLAGAAAIHEILLQSWSREPFGTEIRVFPAVPDAWPDATIHRLRAEGAFLVSAARRGGRTRFVRVESLAGAPCRVETGIEGEVVARGARAFRADTAAGPGGRRITTVDLRKGESVLLLPAGAAGEAPAVEPVAAQPDRCNFYGSPKAARVRAEADGSYVLRAKDAVLTGAKLMFERKSKEGNLGGWIAPEAFVSWHVEVRTPGRFEVVPSYASPGGGSRMTVGVETESDGGRTAGPALEFATRATGGWDKFEPQPAGVLEIAKAGAVEIVARGVAGRAPSVNLEKIVLKPAAGGRGEKR